MITAPSSWHPGRLKLGLAAFGTVLDPRLAVRENLTQTVRYAGSSTQAISVLLPEFLPVTAPIREVPGGGLGFRLTHEGASFLLERDADRLRVEVMPRPDFFAAPTAGGTILGDFARLHNGFLILDLTLNCPLANGDSGCALCGLGLVPGAPDRVALSVGDVAAAIDRALDAGAADYVHLKVGYIADPDRGVRFLEPYVAALRERFDIRISVELYPPVDDAWVDRTYALGIDAVTYHLDVHDAAIWEEVCRHRAGLVPRERYLEALTCAVDVFPRGTVVSRLIVGLEPLDSLQRGIEMLMAMGVIPALEYAWHRGAAPEPPWDLSELEALLRFLCDRAQEYRLRSTWMADFGDGPGLGDARWFRAPEGAVGGALRSFSQSRLGNRLAQDLLVIRRKLRVRNVGESFDSAGL